MGVAGNSFLTLMKEGRKERGDGAFLKEDLEADAALGQGSQPCIFRDSCVLWEVLFWATASWALVWLGRGSWMGHVTASEPVAFGLRFHCFCF